MDIKKDKYIILEIIPTNYKSKNGVIIQISALKIDGLTLIERFDYRLKDDSLPIIELKELINYDNNNFSYVDSEQDILNAFQKFCNNLPIFILNDNYTKEFIEPFNENINYILDYLGMDYSDDVIDKIIDKYHLEPSEHIVDLLYEALMMH